ncbi:MAG: energy transducer TonB [Ignavibacteria bacterium]|nr:energy transducer TonB [Ignavibacteria bacterium]
MKPSRMMLVGLSALFFIFLASMPTKAVTSFPTPNDEEYAPFADEMPSAVGGVEGIIRSMSYPEIAKRSGIEGRVFVLAYINERGGVDDVKIIKGIGAGCDEAACAAVKKAKFTPAKSKGQAIKAKLSLAIMFKLR